MRKHKQQYKRAVTRANAAGVMLLLITAFQYALPALYLWILRLFGTDTAADFWGLPAATYLWMYLLMYVLMMGIPLWLCRTFLFAKSPRTEKASKMSGDRALCLTLFGVALCVLANIFSSFFSDLLYDLGLPTPSMPSMGDGSFVILLFDIIVLALIPAITEELLFRGIVQNTLRPLGKTVCVVITALLFGLLHGNLAQAPYACLMGLILGGIYVHSSSIGTVIAIHALSNTIALLMSYLRLYSDSSTASLWGLVILVVVLMSGGIASMWLWRHPLPAAKPSAPCRRALLNAPLLWLAFAVLLLILLIRTL